MLTSVVSLCLLAFSMFTSSSAALPISNDSDTFLANLGIEERQSSFFGITGVQNNGVQPRLEIRTMVQTQKDQFNLFILGMQRFQAQVQSGQFSYYQIAGIHGLPNEPWDNVGPTPGAGGLGYCTHTSVLFPAWHRPYVALIEQFLYDNVQAVAQSFTGSQQTQYLAAAKNFRLPYWDWAMQPNNNLPVLPLVVSQKMLSVNTPSGQQTILNPLFRYGFHPLEAEKMLRDPWDRWQVTFRYPSNQAQSGDPPTVSQNDQAQNAFQTNRANLAESVYDMFTLCKNYLGFSNDAAPGSDNSPCHNSLESVHDSVHGLMGGNNGHMSIPWFAAFDPVFWLHHANVDRLFAMWQAIYPNQYGASQAAPGSTYTIAQGSNQGPNSPLSPFHDTNGNYFTTNSVRNHRQFGYTYPEFVNTDGSSGAIMQAVNNLYGPATRKSNSKRASPVSPLASLIPTTTSLPTSDGTDNGLSPNLNPNPTTNTSTSTNVIYNANIVYPRFALDGSYTIYLFLGPPPAGSPLNYNTASNLIGSVFAFANPGMVNDRLVRASVPLTGSLVQQVTSGFLNDLNRLNVVPKLKAELSWRVVKGNGSVVPNAQVPGLRVEVVTATFTPPAAADQFPVFGDFEGLPDVTSGKAGGVSITTPL